MGESRPGNRAQARAPEARLPVPPWIRGEENRRRWLLAEAIAWELFGPDGVAAVMGATRAIFFSDIPTDGAPEFRRR
jgi:hypothetical protein